MSCATCRLATPVTFAGVAIGYYICALQVGWQYHTRCNINRHHCRGEKS